MNRERFALCGNCHESQEYHINDTCLFAPTEFKGILCSKNSLIIVLGRNTFECGCPYGDDIHDRSVTIKNLDFLCK